VGLLIPSVVALVFWFVARRFQRRGVAELS